MADDETKMGGSFQLAQKTSEPVKRMARRKAALLSEGPRRSASNAKPSDALEVQASIVAAAKPQEPALRSPVPSAISLDEGGVAEPSGLDADQVATSDEVKPVTSLEEQRPAFVPADSCSGEEGKSALQLREAEPSTPEPADQLSAGARAPDSALAASPTNTEPAISQSFFRFKETIMDMSSNFNGFQGVMSEAQAKAKEAFEKSTHVLGEVSEFTKGNVEAVIESGKIFADGCQEMGSSLVAESRTAFETITSDVKEMAAAKSPTDFFKIQSDMVRKNFDLAMAYGSKNSETMLKLMSDAMAPISGRVSTAVEKARQTATAPATI